MYKTLWLQYSWQVCYSRVCQNQIPRKQSDTGNAPVAVDTTMANGLHLTDIELGQGPPIRPGDYFTAHYTAISPMEVSSIPAWNAECPSPFSWEQVRFFRPGRKE